MDRMMVDKASSSISISNCYSTDNLSYSSDNGYSASTSYTSTASNLNNHSAKGFNPTVNKRHVNNGIFDHDTRISKASVGFSDPDSWQEFSIDVPWGKVQGKWWGTTEQQPVLALHGWQDNCGTFDRLCPLLPADIPILCIDLPGHGKSSPYPKGMQYFLFWDGVLLIRRIVRKFGWKNMTLMGHSLGGALTFVYAASFPTEVEKLINIDIAGPTVRSIERQADATGWALDKFLDYETLPETKLPCYTYDEMIKLVLDAYEGSVDESAVKVLMKRGMAPAPKHLHKDGYHFARDLRLKVSLLGMFTVEQVMAYAKRIRCKVLNIRGVPGMKFENPHVYEEVIETLRQYAGRVIYEKIPGTHHLHLVTPERVAPTITNFLLLDREAK